MRPWASNLISLSPHFPSIQWEFWSIKIYFHLTCMYVYILYMYMYKYIITSMVLDAGWALDDFNPPPTLCAHFALVILCHVLFSYDIRSWITSAIFMEHFTSQNLGFTATLPWEWRQLHLSEADNAMASSEGLSAQEQWEELLGVMGSWERKPSIHSREKTWLRTRKD